MEMMVLPWYYRGNGVRLYDGHHGNSRDGDSLHSSTVVVVMELTVDVDDRAVIKLLRNECRMSDTCAPTLRLTYLLNTYQTFTDRQ